MEAILEVMLFGGAAAAIGVATAVSNQAQEARRERREAAERESRECERMRRIKVAKGRSVKAIYAERLTQRLTNEDNPDRQIPVDGDWWRKYSGGYRDYDLDENPEEDTYRAGNGDRAWAEEKCRNCVFRLERKNRLDEAVPDFGGRGDSEVSRKLFAEITRYRRAKREAEQNRTREFRELLRKIKANTMTTLDFAAITSLMKNGWKTIFIEARKEIGPVKDERLVNPDFVGLIDDELGQILRVLERNQSITEIKWGDLASIVDPKLKQKIDAIAERNKIALRRATAEEARQKTIFSLVDKVISGAIKGLPANLSATLPSVLVGICARGELNHGQNKDLRWLLRDRIEANHLFVQGPLLESYIATIIYNLSSVLQKHMQHQPMDSNRIVFDISDIRTNEGLRGELVQAFQSASLTVSVVQLDLPRDSATAVAGDLRRDLDWIAEGERMESKAAEAAANAECVDASIGGFVDSVMDGAIQGLPAYLAGGLPVLEGTCARGKLNKKKDRALRELLQDRIAASHILDQGRLSESHTATLIYNLSLILKKHMRYQPTVRLFGDPNHVSFDIHDIKTDVALKHEIEGVIQAEFPTMFSPIPSAPIAVANIKMSTGLPPPPSKLPPPPPPKLKSGQQAVEEPKALAVKGSPSSSSYYGAKETAAKKVVDEEADQEKAKQEAAKEATAEITVVEKAREAISQNQLKEAIKILSEAIKIDPGNVELYNLRGDVYLMASGQGGFAVQKIIFFDLAKKDLEMSLSLDPFQDDLGNKIGKITAQLMEINMGLAGFPSVPEPSEISGPSSIYSGQFKSMSEAPEDQSDEEEDGDAPVNLAQFYKPPTAPFPK